MVSRERAGKFDIKANRFQRPPRIQLHSHNGNYIIVQTADSLSSSQLRKTHFSGGHWMPWKETYETRQPHSSAAVMHAGRHNTILQFPLAKTSLVSFTPTSLLLIYPSTQWRTSTS